MARRHGGYNGAIRTTDIRARDGSIREGNRMQLDATAGTGGGEGQVAGADRGVHDEEFGLRGKFYHCAACRGIQASIVSMIVSCHVCEKSRSRQIALRVMRRYVPVFG